MRRLLNTLYVTTEGASLRKDGENLVAEVEGDERARVPFHLLASAVVFGAIYVSPPLIEALAGAEPPPLAILALGVIIRGSTAHADLIAESITRSLQDTGVSHLIPVIHEVLLVESAEQAEVRTLGEELNRGREAAEAAVAMIEVMDSLEA